VINTATALDDVVILPYSYTTDEAYSIKTQIEIIAGYEVAESTLIATVLGPIGNKLPLEANDSEPEGRTRTNRFKIRYRKSGGSVRFRCQWHTAGFAQAGQTF
jgi:hypothetical protein